MKQVMNTLKKKNFEQEKKSILKLELDYELSTLFEAMTENNESQKLKSIEKLEKLRTELLKLKAL